MILSSFLIGTLAGALLTAITIIIQAKRIEKKYQVEEDQRAMVLIEEISKIKAIKSLFAEATKIAEEQANLISQVDQPSRSASHSRYKNGIVGRIKELENRKLDIFESILENGVDPLIMVGDGTDEPTEMRMSELVRERRRELDDENYVPSTDSKNPREKVSHLKLVKNEETQDVDTSSSPVH